MFNTLTRMSVSLVQKYLPSPFVFSALLTLGVLLAGILPLNAHAMAVVRAWIDGGGKALNDWRAQVYFGEDQLLVPVQALINGSLGKQTSGPLFASLASFCVGTLVLLAWWVAEKVL